MTKKGIEASISKQLFDALDRIEKLEKKLDEAYTKIDELEKDAIKKEKLHVKECKKLESRCNKLEKIIIKKDNKIKKLEAEILRLKTKSKKDSSNSSKPSSTNGYKKVITNRRQKSDKPKGKAKGEKSTNLSKEKLQQLIDSGNVEYRIVEVNKNSKNKNKKYKSAKVIDIIITKIITEYRYYQKNDGTYDIPECHNRAIQYGNNLKGISCLLNVNFNNSTDGVKAFIEDITNNGITLAKSTILSWNNKLAENLHPEISNIEEKLNDAYYVNADDSTIKINGDSYYDLCVSNETHTKLTISDKKDHKTWSDKTILDNYQGVIVKDGTDVYNGFGITLSQCASHILRYIKGVYDYVDHSGAKEMEKFIQKCIHERKIAIEKGIELYSQEEIEKLYDEFKDIFSKWKSEWMHSNPENNGVYDDERKLLARFEDESELEQILYFLKDFNVPATNSRGEIDQRSLKIKQKIGKFRSTGGADDYTTIKSCILTYKKHSVDLLDALRQAFTKNPVIA